MSYPFDRPLFECLWSRGAIRDIAAWDSSQEAERTPVLAIGSNASLDRLSERFTPEKLDELGPENWDIPLVRAVVRDIDVVYGAHITRYGAIPATAIQVSGARVDVWLTWLTGAQLEVMDRTEGPKYSRRSVPGVEADGTSVDGAQCYVVKAGAGRFWRADSGPIHR